MDESYRAYPERDFITKKHCFFFTAKIKIAPLSVRDG